MPVYGVIMDQAVSMAHLGDNTLMTGYMQGHALYSCSAIILSNPGAGSAGLYHFPEGDIYEDVGSQTLIRALAHDVNPTQVCVAFGTLGNRRFDPSSLDPADPELVFVKFLSG